jgi:glycosyltransferase involved in cell wall biosynthesis
MMKSLPLVSIICTAYNHEAFIAEALDSIQKQTYPNKEVFLIDNGSSDKTVKKIENWLSVNQPAFAINKIYQQNLIPYCKSFNHALAQSKGKFVLDFSGDDILEPDHILHSVKRLEQFPDAAFCFSDALLFEDSDVGASFYRRDQNGSLLEDIKEGDRYRDVVASHCISSATLVFPAEVLKAIGGYDEELTYEDFDVMVRLTRKYPVVFSDHIGIRKRIHSKSFSSDQYISSKSVMLPSTFRVCCKIKELNQNEEEDEALLQRVMYETKHALWSANFTVGKQFLELARQLGAKGLKLWIYKTWAWTELDLSRIYSMLKNPNLR